MTRGGRGVEKLEFLGDVINGLTPRKHTNSSLDETTLEIWLMPIFFNKIEFLQFKMKSQTDFLKSF